MISDTDTSNVPDSQKNDVQLWCDKIRAAKGKWEDDFERMRESQAFVAGLQWAQQDKIKTNRYVVNVTMQRVNQKVATLYARNPKAVAVRRQRLDFELWDGKQESLIEAVARAELSMQSGMPDVAAIALLADYKQGRQWQELVQKVSRTLEIVYQYECDIQEPDFKESMKNAVVRAAVVCGVGYVRLNFVRGGPTSPSLTNAPQTSKEQMGRVQALLDKINEGEIDETSAQMEELKRLVLSFGVGSPEQDAVEEGLVFDYPPPTSVIPDPRCKSLTTFAGARWVAQEYLLPVEEINAFFGVNLPVGDLKPFNSEHNKANTEDDKNPVVALWEVFSITDKTRFYVIDGYDQYVLEPEPVMPFTKRFWPIFGLVFNPVVVDPGAKVTIFPPSDVDLMFHAQKEWNRTRHALRAHRRANGPKYIVRKGVLTDEDKLALSSAADHEVIELASIPPDQEPSKFILPIQHAPIDPLVYDAKPIEEDIMLGAGAQEANFGFAKPNVTATVGTIAEQSRMTVASSNVDDLDGLLDRLACAGGEMLLREMSPESVKRIAGRGAVWPIEQKEDFLNEVNLTIQAASSGKPNKAIDVANFERLAPIMLQSQVSPQFILREAVRRLDDNLDPAEAVQAPPSSLLSPMGAPTANLTNPGANAAPQQPLQPVQSGVAVPLSAA